MIPAFQVWNRYYGNMNNIQIQCAFHLRNSDRM